MIEFISIPKVLAEQQAKFENEVCSICQILGIRSVDVLLELVKSDKIGYVRQQEEWTRNLSKLSPFAPKPFVMPKDGKPWYKQFENKKHKK